MVGSTVAKDRSQTCCANELTMAASRISAIYDAQYLFTSNMTIGFSVYSPWMARGGDQIMYVLDLVDAQGAKIRVDLLTKNTEDTGDGTVVSTITATNTLGRTPKEYTTGLKELVRYKFTAIADEAAIGFVLFRMLSPVWWDTVSGA